MRELVVGVQDGRPDADEVGADEELLRDVREADDDVRGVRRIPSRHDITRNTRPR
ncbi:hypothetical protein OG880_33240 (plasmid) [Streptomyces cellulosae]|uniref:hypothetical protein n=1 Tax=Streptomyces cellulosae TaxID=1968 RepID=UPI002ED29BD8|nr:hypothetical protein OG880_33240 [Streptomyces cellulosae]